MFKPSVQREIGAFQINLSSWWSQLCLERNPDRWLDTQLHRTSGYWVKCLSWSQHRTFGLLGELQWKCLSWSQQETECKSVKPPALQLGLLFYVEGFSRFSAYKRHIFYATRPDLTPTAYYWLNILGRQSESNSHSFPDLLIPSEQS